LARTVFHLHVDVRVDLRCPDILVPEKDLYFADISPIFEQMCGVGMSQFVQCDILGQLYSR